VNDKPLQSKLIIQLR